MDGETGGGKGPESHRAGARAGRRLQVGITTGLALSFGVLVLVAVISVLGVVLVTADRSTHELLREKATLTLKLVEREVHEHFEHVEAQLASVRRAIADGVTHPEKPAVFAQFLDGALASLPEVHAIEFTGVDGALLRVARHGGKLEQSRRGPGAAAALALVREARARRTSWWGKPTTRHGEAAAFMVLHGPVFHDREMVGVISVLVGTDEIAGFLRDISREIGAAGFIIAGGRHIVASAGRPTPGFRPTPAQPLLPVDRSGDPVLRRIWEAGGHGHDDRTRDDKGSPHIHGLTVDGADYVFVYKAVPGHGGGRWTVGAYLPAASFGAQLDRLKWAGLVGLVALLVSLLLAVWIGRLMSRPVIRISRTAQLVGDLALDEVDSLPASRLRELDQQSNTMNRMVHALRWFQAYVPKPIVRALIGGGDLGEVSSDRRPVTVMFTDIAGYSAVAEGKSAAEIGELLNRHFALVANAIEAEGGTVDKFIGDSVMAFWGAPEKQKNRAIRACRAALAIRRAVHEDNQARAGRGEPPVRVRVGIHSGAATVGNIGPPDRVNYTVIGDDVNVAQRLEQLGKQVAPDEEVAITISAATLADLEGLFQVEPVGEMPVKGRAQPVEVYRLVHGPAASPDSQPG